MYGLRAWRNRDPVSSSRDGNTRGRPGVTLAKAVEEWPESVIALSP
jgi:hypothetical protein